MRIRRAQRQRSVGAHGDQRGTFASAPPYARVLELVLLFDAAVAVFLLIAELLQGEWMLAGSAVAVLGFLLWLGNRLAHVAANQNKDPLG